MKGRVPEGAPWKTRGTARRKSHRESDCYSFPNKSGTLGKLVSSNGGAF